jgi:hypothetical protein
VHWHVHTLGFWDERYAPTFQIVPGTRWWSGGDWLSGERIPYSGQVVAAAQISEHQKLPDFFKLDEKSPHVQSSSTSLSHVSLASISSFRCGFCERTAMKSKRNIRYSM